MEEKLVLHIEIHQLRKRNLRIAQIAKQLKISRNTVYKYLDMTFEEAQQEFSTPHKGKKLDPYQDWIVNWLQEFPHLSGAQIKDWLAEQFPDLDVGESTVRNYVNEIREKFQIEKTAIPRDYEEVEEQPLGKQIQVDWGQTIQKTMDKKEKKLYFIAFVLAHSRYKYMEWQDRPFTTQDTIRCHENAFQYFGGRTEEIVYDQDNLIAVNENAGDVILTKEFQAYVKQQKFRIYLCRKADPESKGMIENVVKYVKRNYADSRIFKDIEDWNQRAWMWLARTGNYKVHNTTKKRPVEVFTVKKQHLQPVSSLLSLTENTNKESITRNVMKDNTIRYESNRYSVPLGTYHQEKQVFLEIAGDKLFIRRLSDGEPIAEHVICKEKGKLIKNRNHGRDRSSQVAELRQEVLQLFPEEAVNFIEKIDEKYPRYRRDQYLILKEVAKESPTFLAAAVNKCIVEKLFSANEIRDIVAYFKKIEKETVNDTERVSTDFPSISVPKREMEAYFKMMDGDQHE